MNNLYPHMINGWLAKWAGGSPRLERHSHNLRKIKANRMEMSWLLPFLTAVFLVFSNRANAQQACDLRVVLESLTQATCDGTNDGAISIQVSNGTAPYSFFWSSGDTTRTLSNLAAGQYDVSVSDADGCSINLTFHIFNTCGSIGNFVWEDSNGNGRQDGGESGVPGITVELLDDANAVLATDITDANGLYAFEDLVPESYKVRFVKPDTLGYTQINACPVSAAQITDSRCFFVAGIGSETLIPFSLFGNLVDGNTYLLQFDLADIGGNQARLALWAGGQKLLNIPLDTTVPQTISKTFEKTAAMTSFSLIWESTGLNARGLAEACNFSISGTGQSDCDSDAGKASLGLTPLYNLGTGQDNNSFDLGLVPCDLEATLGSITDVSCFGEADGAIDLSITGGTGPFTYLWSNGASTQDLSGVSADTFSVEIADANDCRVTLTDIVVSQPDTFSLQLDSVVDVGCFGEETGEIAISVVGGASPFSFLWSSGDTTEDVSGLASGAYSVSVTDANGCTQSLTGIQVGTPDPLIILRNAVTNVGCFGDSTGAIDISVSGGTSPYDFLWNTGATTEDISQLKEGAYRVEVSDDLGCTAVDSNIVILQPAPLEVVLDSLTDVACAGEANGRIDITVSGGNTPYNFDWSNGAQTEDLLNIPAGTYKVLISDPRGCTDSLTNLVVQEPPAFTVTVDSIIDVTCQGLANGRIGISVSGGLQPFAYSWSNGSFSQDLNNVPAGTYSLVVRDGSGCTQLISNLVIEEPEALIVVVDSVSENQCFGFRDAFIDIEVSGGIGPYFYSWSNGDTTQDLSGIPSGTYGVTVTDQIGCNTSITAIEVDEPNPLSVVVRNITDVSCNGVSSGAININVAGGVFPYRFLWSNGDTTEDIMNLDGGFYDVIVSDANNCSDTIADIEVLKPDSLLITGVTVQDVSCFGEEDGAIDITISGGTSPVFYSWSNGASSEDVFNLAAGTYDLTVSDINNCSATLEDIEVGSPEPIQVTVDTVVSASCNAILDGSILITVSGGTGNYTYSWSNGGQTEDLIDIAAGTYSVSVEDENGCNVILGGIVVEVPNALAAVPEVITDVSCLGEADGAIDMTISGGNTPYDILWSTGDTTEDISNLLPGFYTLIVKDSINCEVRATIEIEEPDAITLSATPSVITCDEPTGNIALLVQGGTAPYSYLWSNGDTTRDITGLAVGTYFVTVTDANGCTDTTQATLTVDSTQTLVSISADTVLTCENETVTLTTLTDPQSANFLWAGPEGFSSTRRNPTVSAPGVYTVLVTNTVTGCVTIDSIEVEIENTPPALIAAGDTLTCLDLVANLSVFSPGNVTYAWSGPNGFIATTPDPATLDPGLYSVVVTDLDNGCTNDTIVSVLSLQDLPLISIQGDTLTCADTVGNLIAVTETGNFAFSWTGPQGFSSLNEEIAVQVTGTYLLEVTNLDNGCVAIDSVTLIENTAPPIVEAVGVQLDCERPSARIRLLADIINPEVRWTGPNGFVSTSRNPLVSEPGIYEAFVINPANGCFAIDTAEVTLSQDIPQVFTEGGEVTCDDITIRINAETTVPNAGYFWTGPNGFSSFEKSPLVAFPGTYTVTVTNEDNGCTAQGTALVTENNETPLVTAIGGAITCTEDLVELDFTSNVQDVAVLWTGPNGFSSNNPSPLVSAIGTYTVRVTNLDNGCFQEATTRITQEIDTPVVAATVSGLLNCLTDTVTVSASPQGSFSYNWTGPDGFSAITRSVRVAVAGTYQVQVTDLDNGCEGIGLVEVLQDTVPPVAFAGEDIFIPCGSGEVRLNAGSDRQDVTYTWIGPSGFQTNEANPMVEDAGIYTLVVEAENGCSAEDKVLVEKEVCARVGNRVWEDSNVNGILDEGEQGVGQIKVVLRDGLGNKLDSVLTGNDGRYLFEDLPSGEYSVVFSNLPADFTFTLQDQGADDAVDSDADPLTGETAVFTLISGVDDLSRDAGIVFTKANLGNRVWLDLDRDGFQDDNEPGVPNVRVRLYSCDLVLEGEKVTDAQGEYRFTGLDTTFQYILEVALPDGYEFSPKDQADNDTKDSDVDPETGRTDCITVKINQNNLIWDAGIYQNCIANAGTLTPVNLNDICLGDDPVVLEAEPNGDILRPQGYSVTYILTSGANKVIRQIGNLPEFTVNQAGTYYIHPLVYQSNPENLNYLNLGFIIPGQSTMADLVTRINTRNICASVDGAGVQFVLSACATIGDFVWLDQDRDGIQDEQEGGIEGINVALFNCTGSFVAQTFSDSTGAYVFEGVLPGRSYFIAILDLSESLLPSPINQGLDDEVDSDIDSTGKTACFTPSAAMVNTTIDLGLMEVSNCLADAGSLLPEDSTLCLIDSLTVLAAHSTEPVVPRGYSQAYYLYNKATDIILRTSATPAFTLTEKGNYGIVTLVYNSNRGDPNFFNPAQIVSGSTRFTALKDLVRNTALCVALDTVGAGFQVSRCTLLGDKVWEDLDKDGVQDQEEPGIEGVLVQLLSCEDTLVDETRTSAQGAYQFLNVAEGGSYYLRFSDLPDGYIFTRPNAGASDELDSDVDSLGHTPCTPVAAETVNRSLDAGMYFLDPQASCTVAVGTLQPDSLFKDCFEGGPVILSATEVSPATVPLGYLKIFVLVNERSGVIQRLAFDPEFTVTSSGVYSMRTLVYNPNPFDPNYLDISQINTGQDTEQVLTDQIASRNLCVGWDTTGVEFVISECTEVGGTVFEDRDGNGIQDATDPGIFGIPVRLFRCGVSGEIATTETNVFGQYVFTDVPEELEYYVSIGLPNGYDYSPKDVGTDDRVDSDVQVNGETDCFLLKDELFNRDIDAGIFVNGDCPRECELLNWELEDTPLSHALYLYKSPADPTLEFGQDSEHQRFIWEEGSGRTFTIDGLTIVTGQVRNKVDPSLRFAVCLKLHKPRTWNEWQDVGGGFLSNNPQDLLHTTWTFYQLREGWLIGLGKLAGSELGIYPYFLDTSRGFQMGLGANYRDESNGLAGWFAYEGWLNGEPYQSEGSVNLDIGICKINCRPEIPSIISDFQAYIVDEGVQLSWFTVIDGTTYSIVLERAADCQNFEPLATFTNDLPSLDLNEYFYLDDVVLDTSSTYCYRLRIVKPDGTFEFSEVLEISLDEDFEVYPNPADDAFFVRSKNSLNKFHTILLSDVRGNEIFYNDIVDLYTAPLRISTQDLATGIYFLQIINADGTSTSKMIQVNH